MPAWLSQLWFDDQARHHVDNRDRARGGHGEIARRPRQQRVFVSRKCDPVKSIFSGRSAKYICNRE